MTNSAAPPRPRAFRLPATAPESQGETGSPMVEEQPDAFAPATVSTAELAVETAQKRGFLTRFRFTFAGLFWSALSGLASLAIGLWIARLVEDLFARASGLGWLALGLAVLVGLAILALAVREIIAISRQRKIARLHLALAQARAGDDRLAARAGLAELVTLYASRPVLASACGEIQALSGEIIDGRDLIDLAERKLMLSLDQEARRAIARAARAVSLFTTVSPRALLDVLFVAGQAIALLRKIAEIYGGRPGLLGFIKLARSVGTHLAITGGMAAGDSLVEQLVGHGIAARLSARLGEGVLNGLMTARVGLSAMSVCRPMPFSALPAPSVKDVVPELFSGKVQG